MAPKAARFPWVTAGFAALAVGVYAWSATRSDAEFLRLMDDYALRADRPRAACFLSSLAFHVTAWHLAVNLALLAVFGPGVESRGTPAGLLAVGLLSGVAGGLVHVWLAPAAMRSMALVGASGALSGVLGAHAALLPKRRIRLGIVVLWALLNLGAMLLVDPAGDRGLSYAAHLGGLAAGAALGALLGLSGRKRD